MVGKEEQYIWQAFAKFTRQLDQLQQKTESFADESYLDPTEVTNQYWNKIGSNLLDLAKKIDNPNKVCTLF